MEQQQAQMVYDAKGKILGRLASQVAKSLLMGNEVSVINSEHAIISGNRKDIIQRYKTRVNLKEKANPEHSPYWSRRPDLLVKRIIRGMLPYRMPRGKSAYRKLKVYIGVPAELSGKKPIEIESKDPKGMYVNHMTIKELSSMLGYTR
ncbi:50S ribosomal protein L13 [Candidatus Marsarchaeota archaeon]|nr:50S ribosomal protein L13 [Candidatus Marsarchaeota archaeon]